MKNEYEVRGDITAIFVESRKYGRKEILISTNRLEMVGAHANSWHVNWSRFTKTFYAGCCYTRNHIGSRTRSLHRLITNAPDGMFVDHVNHDTLDNTDGNLRIVTVSENGQNVKASRVNNKSGFRGVHWDKANSRWKAQVGLRGKIISLGCYTSLEEAKQVVLEARRELLPHSMEIA